MRRSRADSEAKRRVVSSDAPVGDMEYLVRRRNRSATIFGVIVTATGYVSAASVCETSVVLVEWAKQDMSRPCGAPYRSRFSASNKCSKVIV
jgi:hypothetical protein